MVTLLLELVPCLLIGGLLGRALPALPALLARPDLEGTARLVLASTLLALATVPLWNRLLHSLPPGSSGWGP